MYPIYYARELQKFLAIRNLNVDIASISTVGIKLTSASGKGIIIRRTSDRYDKRLSCFQVIEKD